MYFLTNFISEYAMFAQFPKVQSFIMEIKNPDHDSPGFCLDKIPDQSCV